MNDQLALSVLAHYDIFSAVPLESEISYADIASKVKLPENRVRRFIRQAMTNHIFTESRPGFVTHTATSAIPVKLPALRAFIGHNTEDGGPASVKVIEAMEKWGASEEPAESGFGIAWGLNVKDGKDCVFKFVQQDGEGDQKGFRMKRIGQAMESMKGDGAYHVGHVQRGFDWAGLGKATVVDVSRGSSCASVDPELSSWLDFIEWYSTLTFVVARRIRWSPIYRDCQPKPGDHMHRARLCRTPSSVRSFPPSVIIIPGLFPRTRYLLATAGPGCRCVRFPIGVPRLARRVLRPDDSAGGSGDEKGQQNPCSRLHHRQVGRCREFGA